MLKSEQRRDNVTINATKYGLLDHFGFGLVFGNDALAFFSSHADRLEHITPSTLIKIATLRRDHPNDWQERASASLFRAYPRAGMQPRGSAFAHNHPSGPRGWTKYTSENSSSLLA
jgi:hypothetical protein